MKIWSSVSPEAFPFWEKISGEEQAGANCIFSTSSCTHNMKPHATWLCLLHYRDVVLGLFAFLDKDGAVFCLQFLPPLLPFTVSHFALVAQEKQTAHWEMQYLQGLCSVASVGASEPFPQVKCLNGSAASEAAVGWPQRPYNCPIFLTSGKLGLLSSAIPPP